MTLKYKMKKLNQNSELQIKSVNKLVGMQRSRINKKQFAFEDRQDTTSMLTLFPERNYEIEEFAAELL